MPPSPLLSWRKHPLTQPFPLPSLRRYSPSCLLQHPIPCHRNLLLSLCISSDSPSSMAPPPSGFPSTVPPPSISYAARKGRTAANLYAQRRVLDSVPDPQPSKSSPTHFLKRSLIIRLLRFTTSLSLFSMPLNSRWPQ